MNAPEKIAGIGPVITTPQVHEARKAAKASGKSVYAELEAGCQLGAREFVESTARLFGMPVVETAQMFDWTPAFDALPLPKAMQRDCVLFGNAADGYAGVVPDPFDASLQDWLEAQAGAPVRICLALRADIHAYLARQEAGVRAIDSLQGAGNQGAGVNAQAANLSLKSISEDSSPVVKIVNSTLYDGLKEGASDIHLRRTTRGMQIKYRIDGVLVPVTHIDGGETAEQMISRIKVLAELDIAERRVPQDGKFQVAYQSRNIDIRVSVMPTIHGEAAVLRILDKRTVIGSDGQLHLNDLGFDTGTLDMLRILTDLPYGMLLVTGPTGSGKTTTLYAAISEVNTGRDNFLTIEDPVEYELDDVEQIPVNEKQGLTFARGLRSILRHDPDKIMVGEIRDRETAEMAIQAALTGHTVYSTLHANNSFDVFNRLAYMNIDPYSLTSALNGIWAQRLLRTNCPHCSVAYVPKAAELTLAGLDAASTMGFLFRRGHGCGDCRGTGFKGRKAIAEVMAMTDRLRQMIAEKASIITIKDEARRGGTRFLRDVALDMARLGQTTLSEVARVTLAA
ncbi:MAG: putative ral secretion pathway gspe-related protein [Betaproteobacteria bacterium]|nr:putative ral secretion pathway gspe-related protein [Betaproteobacteria bacterium]